MGATEPCWNIDISNLGYSKETRIVKVQARLFSIFIQYFTCAYERISYVMSVAIKESKSLQTKGPREKANAQDVFSIPELKSSALNHS